MKHVQTIIDMIRRNDPKTESNQRGNLMTCAFWSAERYAVDFADDFTSEGWEQFDTDQDAAYFGVWVNRTKRLVLTYAEGDWYIVDCANDERYNAEIKSLIEFYSEGYEFKTIDRDGTPTTYCQDREKFYIPNAATPQKVGTS